MKQVMNYHKDNGLLNMIRRTDPMIKNIKIQDFKGFIIMKKEIQMLNANCNFG